MPSLGSETAGEEEEADRRRQEAEGRMMELARACGELGTPPSSQRRSSARLRPREPPPATQYKLVKRSTKRKRARATTYENESDVKPKRAFNSSVRCSLKEFFECADLLKDRHVARVRKAGFGAMLDGKVRGLISRPLIGFLMGKIDPATMTMKLGESKVVAITSDAIHHLFGLPQGGHMAPRPSESGHDRAVMKLKLELGFKRSDNIMTRNLRGLLKRLVEDEEKDDLALKVFFLVVFMKVICPGASARVSREAAMLEDLDFDKMADMDFCQLLVDELQRAVVRYQNGKGLWQGITGCAIAPLLIYLDCCNLRKVSELDTRTPRTHFMTADNLKKIANADLVQKGSPDTQTWLYGKLPWKAHKDIVYYELIVEPICLVPPIARGSQLRRSSSKKTIDTQGAVADDVPAPAVAGSSNGVAPESERSNDNVAATALNQINVLLARACDLSRQVPTSSSRLSHTKGILPPGHGFDAEAAKEGLSKEATLVYPGTEASPDPRAAERMPSLGSETAGEEEVDRRRPEAEERMMELARACGELGTPPYPQRRSSARLRPPEAPAATQYEFVKRPAKRKRARGTAYENEADMKFKRGFNKTIRCSLKEFFECAELLKDRHLTRVRKAGFGAMLDGKVRGLISRPLVGFLMGKIDPATMTMKLGESKVVAITSDAIHHLFGLPQGGHTAPRPSESGYDKAVMKLKLELGFKRSDIIMTRDLRGLLKRLVEDEKKDELALKVFFLVVFMKVICPGASAHVSREAAMLEDLDFDKMADMDFCQLLVDELQRAVVRYQNGKGLWQGITGCAIAPLLMYLDCCYLRKVSELDTRTPRTHFMTDDNLKKIASADLIQKGGPDPQTWLYGKLPWKAYKDIVYHELIVEPICLLPPIARGAQLRRSSSKKTIDPQGAVAEDAPAPAAAGSRNGVAPKSARSNDNVAATAPYQIDVLLAKACDLSCQVPTSSARLSHTEGILPPGHGFDTEATKEAALLYPGTEASPDTRAAERMPSLGSEAAGVEEVDRRRPEAEERMMELARACGELGMPPYPQRRSSARLRPPEAPAPTQYEFVKRPAKRKRASGTAYENEADVKLRRGFNKTVRCSLKEFFECAELLKDRHLARVRKAGFGAMLDGKVRGLICRPLIGFLMGKIDPATMTLKLGESKVVAITSDAIHHLFGLPQGGHTAPRPSESGYDNAVMKLKLELGFKRSDIIMTRDLRGLLKRLVEDEEKDELALKVFFLVVFMKVICPGASARVSREAAILEDLDFDKMAEMDFCQLLVDELQRAVVRYQSGKALWQAITGCAIAPLLIYLDCCNLRKVSKLDTRTPRIHFMTDDNLKKIASADLIQKGGPDPETWLYGKLPWKAHKDIAYYELIVEPICSVPPIARSARLRHSTPKKTMDPQGAVADDDPAPAGAGSSNGVAPESERSNENVAGTALSQIDVLLARACDLSRQVPTTSARLSRTEGILPPGHGFDAEAAKEGLSKEAALLDHLQKATFHLRSSFALFKSVQDDRCRPYEDEAKSFAKRMAEQEAAAAAAARGSERGMEAPADEFEENVDHFMSCDEDDAEEEEEAASPVSTPPQDLSSDTDDDEEEDSDYAG